MAEKRRLPVLKAPADPPSEEEEARPAWHWVGFGVVVILAAWLPLAYLAEFVKGRIISLFLGGPVETQDQAILGVAALSSGDRARLTVFLVGLPALGLALGALGGGYVVGRFSAHAGTRESFAAGALVGMLMALLSVMSAPSVSPASIVSTVIPIALAAVAAALGGRWGARRRSVLRP